MSQPPQKLPSKFHRRDFLLGRSVLQPINQKSDHPIDSPAIALSTSDRSATVDSQPQPPPSIAAGCLRQQAAYWETYTKQAMACQFEILLNFGQYPLATITIEGAFQLIEQLEAQLTVYRDESEVSKINRLASQEAIHIEAGLFNLLQIAFDIYQQTAGAFDITADPLSQVWGFKQRQVSLPTQSAINVALSRVGSDKLILDSNRVTVQFAHDQLSINLGAIGKGHAVDQAAALMRQQGIADFVIHAGQSSALAIGRDATDEFISTNQMPKVIGEHADRSGWRIGLSHPVLPDRKLCDIVLRNAALSTSGTARQGFYHHGKRYGHIIDPRTGWPADHFLSTTVICSSAARADALATAFHCLSLEQISDFCLQHPEIKAIVVSNSKYAGHASGDKAEVDGDVIDGGYESSIQAATPLDSFDRGTDRMLDGDAFGLFWLRTFNLEPADLIPLHQTHPAP